VKRIPLLVLALPLACVFDKQLDPQESDASSSGEATTPDASDDSMSMTGNSATTVVPGDDSGTDTTTGGAGAACGTDQAVLTTEIDAVQESVLWDSSGYYFDEMGVGVEFSAGGTPFWPGMLLMRASSEDLSMPGPIQGSGYVREPLDAPTEPNAWYCFDATSTFLDADDEVTVSLEGLRRFGACPGGEPLEGTMTACFGDASCGGEAQLDVALTGAAYTTELPGSSSSASGLNHLLLKYTVGGGQTGSAGLLGIHATGYSLNPPGIQVLPLGEVFFISPLDQPDGGAIYCAGEGSTMTYDSETGDPISAALTNITRLGSCSDDDEGGDVGTGQFCANFGGE
jgi:hypothetical protein